MGKRGVQEVAQQNLQKAHYAASRISELRGFDLRFTSPFFNEFVVRTPAPASEVSDRLLEQKIIAGLALERYYPEMRDSLLVCVTETTRKEAIDNLVDALRRI
jgi:glycine dehydrogenase subunit 1